MAQTNWLFIIVIFFAFLGFLTSGILFFVNRNQSIAPRILALLIFCLSYGLFGYGLYMSGEFLNFPHLWRTPVFLSLCIAPLTLIYVRSVLDQAYRLRKWDYLFFVPAVLYTAQLLPFYLLPAAEKIPYIQRAMESKAVGLKETEGLLPPGVAIFFRMSYNLGILGYAYVLLHRWKRSDNAVLLKVPENRPIFSWLVYLTILLIFCYVSLIIGSTLQITEHFGQVRLSSITATLTICFICVYLYFKPEILYGFKGWLPVPVTPEGVNPSEKKTKEQMVSPSKKVTISQEQGQTYKAIIQDYFREHKPFTKPRYSIKDLSAELAIPSYLLSSFINQEYGKNFNEFVNDQRIDYLVELVKQEPQHLDYTLEVLGQLGGFNSRSTFIEAVKRRTGKMPSEVFQKTATS
jgi:AraC-like DNA-binding protein